MADPQIYRLIDLTSAAATALLSERPGAQPHIVTGRYGDVLEGWTAQAALVRSRLAREVLAGRLKLATGQGLRELVGSEYGPTLAANPQAAIGEVTIRRQITNASSGTADNFTTGVIPAGTRVYVSADPSAWPARAAVEFETTEPIISGRNDTSAPVIASGGNWLHTQELELPLRARKIGPAGNLLPFSANGVKITSTLFDTFQVVILVAAGGTHGVVDDQLRALAQACYLGQAGPTATAALAGALSNPRVRQAVYVRSPSDAVDRIFIADESWAVSEALKRETLRGMYDGEWLGFGARVKIQGINNFQARCAVTVTLRDSRFLADRVELLDIVQKALARYFDARINFWAWTKESIAATVAGCDPKRRILTVDESSVTVTNGNGAAFALPSAVPDPLGVLIHYWLVASDVSFDLPT